MRRRTEPWTPLEAFCVRILRVGAYAGACLMVALAVGTPIIHAVEAGPCPQPKPAGMVRDRVVSAPVGCHDGSWRITVPRGKLTEDAYGWNCYLDGNGICGPLKLAVRGCLTDPTDGYTMCWDGRVFYLDGTDHRWPVMRVPS